MSRQPSAFAGVLGAIGLCLAVSVAITLVTGMAIHWLFVLPGIYLGLKAAQMAQ